uniref:Uncharacterized protein n=1 Tax=Lotharella oceanica TaxID=641309 RepID=A0A7S2TGC8_9EUKA
MHASLLPVIKLMSETLIFTMGGGEVPQEGGGTPGVPPSSHPRELRSLMGSYSETIAYLLYHNPGILSDITPNPALLIDTILTCAHPETAMGEAEGWRERELQQLEAERQSMGPAVPNMRYEFVPIVDAEGLGRHRRFFAALACSSVILNQQPPSLALWQNGVASPTLVRMVKMIIRANADRNEIENDREEIRTTVEGKTQERTNYPTDETNRLRLSIAMEDSMFRVNVPDVLRAMLERFLATFGSMETLQTALGLTQSEANVLLRIQSGEQAAADARERTREKNTGDPEKQQEAHGC